MAKAAQLEIEIIAHAEKAIAEMDKVKGASGEGFNAMKAAGVAAGLAVAGELVHATEAAADHQTHVAKLEQAYKDAGLPIGQMKTALEENDAAARKTGQSADDLDDAFTKLVTATKDTTKAHEELGTAQDLAAFKGISVADASDAIIKANEGNTKSLKAMGIATTDANGKQLDATHIMENLTAAVHGQADAYGQTAEGGLKRFHESTEQLQVALGNALLPALQSVINALMPLFDWLSRNQGLVSTLVPIVAGLGAVVLTIVEAVRVWTAVQTALDVVLNANPIGLIIIAVAALVAGVIYAYNHFAIFHNAVQTVWEALKAVGSWIMGNWKYIVDILLGPVGIIITNLGTVQRVINDIISALQAIGRAASDAFGWLGKVANVGGGIGKVLGSLNPFSAGGGGAAPTPVMIAVYATPGDSLPEVVYDALRSYQRRHARPELRSMFG
jgi:phage-related protein